MFGYLKGNRLLLFLVLFFGEDITLICKIEKVEGFCNNFPIIVIQLYIRNINLLVFALSCVYLFPFSSP